jgi:hypothetical protein
MVQFKKEPIQGLKRIFPPDNSDCGSELALRDSIAQEGARLSGTRFLLHSLRRAKNRHPLYKEPSQGGDWAFHGPFEMWGALAFSQGDEIQPEALTEGIQVMSDARLEVARKEFEDACSPFPKVGDVIEVWTLEGSPFSETGLNSQWDVVLANPDSNTFTSEEFVTWVITLKRRSKFLAIRKTANTRT